MPVQMPRRAPVKDERGALEWMRCPEYLDTEWYKDDRKLAGRKGLLPSLVHFGDRLCDEFQRMGIPLRVSYPDVDTWSLEVFHCILGDDLPDLCWSMLAAKAAWLAQSMGYGFAWSHVRPGQIELDNLVIGFGLSEVSLDADGWPVVVDPRWRLESHKWVCVGDDPDAVVTTY